MCPSVSKGPESLIIMKLDARTNGCPVGSDLMRGATIPAGYIGTEPWVIRPNPPKTTIVRGSIIDGAALLNKKFGCTLSLSPGRGFNGLVKSAISKYRLIVVVACLTNGISGWQKRNVNRSRSYWHHTAEGKNSTVSGHLVRYS